MFTSNAMDSLLQQLISRLGQGKDQAGQASYSTKQTNQEAKKFQGCGTSNGTKNRGVPLPPQKLLVILGLLSGALEVTAVQVDKDQTVEFLLAGTLKRPTRLDKILDEIGRMPFDDVLKAVLDRLS